MRRVLPWIAALALFALALRNDFVKSIWIDEAYSLDTAGRPLAGTLRQALHFELQPPVYFLVLHLWLKISSAVWFARALSSLFAVGTVLVMTALARRLQLAALPLWVALSPALVWAASETRGYSLAIYLTACTTLVFHRVFVAGERRFTALFVALHLISLFTFYYTGFVLAGQLLAALLRRENRARAVACGAAIALLFAPFVPTVMRQAAAHPNLPLGTVERAPGVVGALRWAIEAGLQGIFYDAPLATRALPLLVFVALCAAIAIRRYTVERAMMALAAVIPLAILLALRAFDLVLVDIRHCSVILAPFWTGIAALLAGVGRPRIRLGFEVALVVFMALAALSFQRNFSPHTDWRSAAAWVNEAEQPGEPIVIFISEGALPFSHVHRGKNPVFGIPEPVSLDAYQPERFTLHSEAQLEERLAALVGPDRSFWLIRNFGRGGGAEIVEAYVARRLTGETRKFKGITVYHLRTPAVFP